jgi:hypothetical protein
MSVLRSVLTVLCLVGSTACTITSAADRIERSFNRTFEAAPGSRVRVRVSGGAIEVVTRPGRAVVASLTARVRAGSVSQADRALADYNVLLTEGDGTITISARRSESLGLTNLVFGDHGGVQFRAELTAPPDVVLDLGTSGGRINVRGDRTAPMKARTSGGSIELDGGSGDIDAETSGGSIRVGRVETLLRADTSGGSIRVGHVAPGATVIDLATSGGSIDVAIDPAASLKVSGQTSGGSVTARGLLVDSPSRGRSRLEGILNGGTGTLRARTSGGSVHFRSAGE